MLPRILTCRNRILATK